MSAVIRARARRLLVVAAVLAAGGLGCKLKKRGPDGEELPAAASSASSASAAKSGDGRGALEYGFTEGADTLVPYRPGNETSRYLQELVFDGLVNRIDVRSDGRQEMDWVLGESYAEKSELERKDVIVNLRRGVRWHDGHPFSADDVVYSWRALAESRAPMAGWLRAFISELRKVDENTIELKLNCERSPEVAKELLSSFKILPAKAKIDGDEVTLPTDLSGGGVADDFSYRPVGTGPFKVDGRFQTELTRFAVNESYVRAMPALRAITARRIEDYDLLVKRLSTGEITLATDVRPESFSALEGKPVDKKKFYPYRFAAVFYNGERGAFRNPSFRRAVTSATNRSALAEKVFAAGAEAKGVDAGEFVNTSIFPHNHEQVLANAKAFETTTPFDLKRAKEWLQKSKQRPGFTLLVSSAKDGRAATAFAQEYKREMAAAGIDVIVVDESESRYHGLLRRNDGAAPEYEAALVDVTGFDHFYDVRPLFLGDDARRAGLPPLLAPVAKADDHLREALKDFGETIAYEKLGDITRRIHESVEASGAVCPLFTLPRYAYYSRSLSRVTIHPEVGFGRVQMWKSSP
jgi:peptide/nickel transport system substrate-binding protein